MPAAVRGARRFRKASARTAAGRLELGIIAAQTRQQLFDFPSRRRLALRREWCVAPSAGDSDPDSCSTRGRLRSATRAATRCRAARAAARLQSRSSGSSPFSTRAISRIASRPSRGRLPCAARPSVSISTHSNPLCAMATCRSVGSVTTAASARHRVTSASAPILACSSSTTQAITSRPAARPPDSAITRAASIIAATPLFMSWEPRPKMRPSRSTGSNGAFMPATPTVSMWPQNISDRPALARRACRRRSAARARRPGSRPSSPCRASPRRSYERPPPRPRRPPRARG